MRTLLAVLSVSAVFAGCGDSGDPSAPAATTPAPTETAAVPHDLDEHSEGVKRHYGEAHAHTGEDGDVEAEYHQPPTPPQAAVGEMITLTGANIGVRMETTVTGVERRDGFYAVSVEAESTGIAMFAGPFQGELTFPGGKVVPNDPGAEAACTKTLQDLWVGEGERAEGCLLFPVESDEEPERVQVSLETVPADAGGIWTLK